MKQSIMRGSGRMLMVLVISSLLVMWTGVGLVTADIGTADPVRQLPADPVMPGDEFEVIITFTSPAAALNAIGTRDLAPAGWTVSVDTAWCTPPADAAIPVVHWSTDLAAYTWTGPYAADVEFTAVYRVRVPHGAAAGIYEFPAGELEYYIAGSGPIVEPIRGDFLVEVEVDEPQPPTAGMAYPVWIVLIAGLVAGALLLVLRRRRVRA